MFSVSFPGCNRNCFAFPNNTVFQKCPLSSAVLLTFLTRLARTVNSEAGYKLKGEVSSSQSEKNRGISKRYQLVPFSFSWSSLMYSVNMPEPEAELGYDTVNQGKSAAGISGLKVVCVYCSDHGSAGQIPSLFVLRIILFSWWAENPFGSCVWWEHSDFFV